ncbi:MULTISPECIES: hypothetical protein [Nostoc]|uniref:Uncharacterized protein n=1 Tax=Nostoc paludosum FACHB-159 TaxID=2692908 RepID=A0ABR8K121_9NOSO|nr:MULTISPECIES: hypothetical protein [Nostoc]MBD2676405.1 hypothetical protein [Nostoc sp. FACHB-857]MBD2732464.1 hypothetical protein [Nostoc paludosum FACHB-159]
MSNIWRNAKYNLIEKIIRRYPDLQDVLETCDFEPLIKREDYRLVVVQPKVAIACNLPKVFAEGNCEIDFSNIILRDLKISLNHQDILGQLMTGLNTQPDWSCRKFLKQLDGDYFEVNLGKTTLILSKLETLDLCFCVDIVCQEYKKSIIQFENYLETWDFEFVDFANIRGFILFSVGQKLWKLMQQFADEFDYSKGKSEWHLFDNEDMSIRVSRGIHDHAFILPRFDSNLAFGINNKINIIYKINNVCFQSFQRGKVTSWQQDIGLRGTWTAKYTKQWLLEKYIPQVISYYLDKFQLSETELLAEIINYQGERVQIQQINDIKDLLPYLRHIHSWLHIYKENIAASLLQSYYQAFTDLIRNTDSSITGIDYIMRNLLAVNWQNTQIEIPYNFNQCNFKDAMNCLDEQVARINNSKYENSFKADLITRTFIWIIENGKISFSQAQLNAAKQALQSLWEESRFEMRHLFVNQ